MKRDKQYYVYILTNKTNRVLYIGVTNDLLRRIFEHKNKLVEGFSKKYNLTKLIYYEGTSDVKVAISREKRIKGWLRSKKIALIESVNPDWRDLSSDWFDEGDSSVTSFPQNDKRHTLHCHSFAPCHSEAKPKNLLAQDKSEPFAPCHSERSEESQWMAQGRLREESLSKHHKRILKLGDAETSSA